MSWNLTDIVPWGAGTSLCPPNYEPPCTCPPSGAIDPECPVDGVELPDCVGGSPVRVPAGVGVFPVADPGQGDNTKS